jgi:hypothetical protein
MSSCVQEDIIRASLIRAVMSGTPIRLRRHEIECRSPATKASNKSIHGMDSMSGTQIRVERHEIDGEFSKKVYFIRISICDSHIRFAHRKSTVRYWQAKCRLFYQRPMRLRGVQKISKKYTTAISTNMIKNAAPVK